MKLLISLFILSCSAFCFEVPKEIQELIPSGKSEVTYTGQDCKVVVKDRGWSFMIDAYRGEEFITQWRIDDSLKLDDYYANSAGLEAITQYDSPMGPLHDRKLHFILYYKGGKPHTMEILEKMGTTWGNFSLAASLWCQL